MYELGLEDSDRVASTLGGGLPSGSLVLLEGEDGAGKSVFCQRFTRGFCSEGYSVTYVSPEYDAAGFIEQMLSLDYDVRDNMVTERNLLFLHADVDVQERLRSDTDEARDLFIEMLAGGAMWDSDIVIIDSLDQLLNNDPRFGELAERGEADVAIQNFVDFLRGRMRDGTTVILTLNDEAVDEEIVDPLRNHAGVYLTLQKEQAAGEVRRQAVVNRFTQMRDEVDDIISYRVQPGLGITIETRTVT